MKHEGNLDANTLKKHCIKYYAAKEFAKKRTKYAYHVLPQTKEALLYRETFESIVPDCACWIQDYLMNKTWPDCDMDDSSAHV